MRKSKYIWIYDFFFYKLLDIWFDCCMEKVFAQFTLDYFVYFIAMFLNATLETHEHLSWKNEIEESKSPMPRIINAEICLKLIEQTIFNMFYPSKYVPSAGVLTFVPHPMEISCVKPLKKHEKTPLQKIVFVRCHPMNKIIIFLKGFPLWEY